MPDIDYEAALDGLIAGLKQARIAAGTPSYNRMSQMSARLHAGSGGARVEVLGASTIQEILAGRRQQPLKWPRVRSYVIVLQEIAKSSGIPADAIGSLEEWKEQVDAVWAAYEHSVRRPVGVGGRHRKQAGQGGPSGQRIVPAPRAAYSQQDELHSQVLRMLMQAGAPQWWHRYRDITTTADWMEFYLYLESAAKVIRTYEPQVIPGLLQAEEYAYAISARCRPDASEREITRRVELRLARQELLSAVSSCQLWAIIEVAALRDQQIDARVMRAQLTHLINVSEEQHITLQVLLPPALDDNVTIGEPITHFRFPEEHLGDVVFLEQSCDAHFLTDRSDIEHYSQILSRLGMRAAREHEVQDLLHKILTDI